MEAFGKFILSIMIGTLAVFSQACAAVLLWCWFVVPFFHIAPLTWNVAYGLILVIGVLHHTSSPEYKDDSFTGMISRVIGVGIIGPWLSVGIGWLVK